MHRGHRVHETNLHMTDEDRYLLFLTGLMKGADEEFKTAILQFVHDIGLLSSFAGVHSVALPQGRPWR